MSAEALDALSAGVRAGDRRLLARAITLVESARPEDRARAQQLLRELGQSPADSFRIGVTGAPGAGKSSLIDALGRQARQKGERVAVLAVDPSSAESGGSVLGDKTRMAALSADPDVFIRPSPARGLLGGTASDTDSVIELCEAAGYRCLFVETVGVGQSEQAIADMVDLVLWVLLPDAGDELSAIKRGLSEVADLIVMNKVDGERAAKAEPQASQIGSVLGLSRGRALGPCLLVSAREGRGIPELWSVLTERRDALRASGELVRRRQRQRAARFEAAIQAGLRTRFTAEPSVQSALAELGERVRAGALSPRAAAEQLLDRFAPFADPGEPTETR